MANVTSLELDPVLIECRSCRRPIWAAPPLQVSADAVPGAPSLTIPSRPDVPDAVALRVDRCLTCADRDAGGAPGLEDYAGQAERIRRLAGLAGREDSTLQLIVQCFTRSQLERAKLGRETGAMLGTWAAWCHGDPLMADGELLPDLPFSVWLPDPHEGPRYALVGVAEVWSLEGVPTMLIELPGLDGSGTRRSLLLPACDGGTVSHDHETRLRACAALLRRSRPPGRPPGPALDHLTQEEFERAFDRLICDGRTKAPSKEEFARAVGAHPGTVDNRLRTWKMPKWSEFKRQRLALNQDGAA